MSTRSRLQQSGQSIAHSQSRLTPNKAPSAAQYQTPQAPSQKNAAVISLDELERIRASCAIKQKDAYEIERNAERKTLQQQSLSRVQNWPNTLQATRLRKQEERIKKLEDEELERRRVDAEEEAYRQDLRQQQLERTKKQQNDNQDMVKCFKSKMLMCDVAQENNAQMQLKKRKQKIEQEIDQYWQDTEKQKMQEYDAKTRTKLEKEYYQRQENAKMINEQLEEYKLSFIKRMKEDMLEGELIKRQVEEDLEREKQKELQRQQLAAERKADLVKANRAMIEAQEQERLNEIEQDKKIEEHAKKVAAMDQMKKDRELEKFSTKQATRQALIDRQIDELRARKSNEETILTKQVAEAEHRANQLYVDQMKKQQRLKSDMEESRRLQILRIQKEKEFEKKQEQELAEFWKVRNEELLVAEQQEKEEERKRNQELQAFLKQQSAKKQEKIVKEYKDEYEAAIKAQALSDQNEKNFYSFSEQAIKQWQAEGKNVKPLIMELKNYRKRVV